MITNLGRDSTGLIFGPLLCLVYINHLPKNLESLAKLFADDTSLFSVILNKQLLAQNFNKDLTKINFSVENDPDLVNKLRKITFNPDPSKQTQEVIFS